MLGRRLACMALSLGLAVLAPSRARAGDSPGERLGSDWAKAADDARAGLLDAAVAAPSKAALDGVVRAGRASLGAREEAERMRKRLLPPELPPPAGEKAPPPPSAEDLAAAADLASHAARETAALDRLAEALGRILDALPEAAVPAAVSDLLSAGAAPGPAGQGTFLAAGIGASRLPRTAFALLEDAADARRERTKAQAKREEPARKLDEVIKKLNDAVDRYLKAARAKGDDSGLVPAGLVGTLPDQQKELQGVVNRLGDAIDAADRRRAVARDALTLELSGLVAADAERVLDVLEARTLRSENVEDRGFGLLALARTPGARALRLLTTAADGKDPRDASAALDALAERDDPALVPLFARHVVDDGADWRLRAAAASALGRTGRASAVPPLLDALASAKGRLLDDLRAALVALTGEAYPAVEAPWRAWWNVAGEAFRGPKDPGAAGAGKGGAAGGKGAPTAPAAAADDPLSFYGIQSHSTRVLFVLDFSGSMTWAGSENDPKLAKIDVLRREMKKSLAGLPDGATFNLIAFSGDVRPWKKEPQVRSGKTAAEALLWVEKMPPDGGTNIGDALETAFRMMGAGLEKDRAEAPAYDTVFFMTDGKPSVGKMTETRQLLAAVRRWNEGRKVRLHVVGLGGHAKRKPASPPPPAGGKPSEDDLDEGFLKDLAAQNGGQCVIR